MVTALGCKQAEAGSHSSLESIDVKLIRDKTEIERQGDTIFEARYYQPFSKQKIILTQDYEVIDGLVKESVAYLDDGPAGLKTCVCYCQYRNTDNDETWTLPVEQQAEDCKLTFCPDPVGIENIELIQDICGKAGEDPSSIRLPSALVQQLVFKTE